MNLYSYRCTHPFSMCWNHCGQLNLKRDGQQNYMWSLNQCKALSSLSKSLTESNCVSLFFPVILSFTHQYLSLPDVVFVWKSNKKFCFSEAHYVIWHLVNAAFCITYLQLVSWDCHNFPIISVYFLTNCMTWWSKLDETSFLQQRLN